MAETISTFANGQTFTSSALSPPDFETIFQSLVANILGFVTSPVANPAAWSAVRLAWQQGGQPAPNITQDVCILQATPANEPYSQVRDGLVQQNDDVSVNELQAYTQIWNLAFTIYGPNSFQNARLIVSAMFQEWVYDALSAYNIYAVPTWNRPQWAPELFEGNWWPRTDVKLQFNEQVNESTIVPSAASMKATIIEDTGLTETFIIPPGTPWQP